MLIIALYSALAGAPLGQMPACNKFLVDPGPEQGMSDAALVSRASHHATGPRDLGSAMAGRGWRIVWATPADSEPGVFFFRGRPGAAPRLVDTWGGTPNRKAALHFAQGIGVPQAMAQCFANRLVSEGV